MRKKIIVLLSIFVLFALMPVLSNSETNVTELDTAYLTCSHTILPLNETVTWELNVSPDGFSYDYSLCYLPFSINSFEFNIIQSVENTEEKTFSYLIRDEGRYYFMATIHDSSGETVEIGSQIYTTDVHAEGQKTLSGIVAEIAAECRDKGNTSDYEIALYMHDYLITHADYGESDFSHYPEGVLLNGVGVCDSYSHAYQMLMSEMGIPCLFIAGDAESNIPEFSDNTAHSWNLVKINGTWYHVDCTYDDPLNGYPTHQYFLLSNEQISQDHTWNHCHFPECEQEFFEEANVEFSDQASFNSGMNTIFGDKTTEQLKQTYYLTCRYTGDDPEFSQDMFYIVFHNWKRSLSSEREAALGTTSGYINTYPDGRYHICINGGNTDIPEEVVLTSGDYNYQIIDNQIRIVRYIGSDSHVVVPDEIEGYPVTILGSVSFMECECLKSVVLPSTLTTIEDGRYGEPNYRPLSAFGSCAGLTTVTIPGSVHRIGKITFMRCTSLTNVNLGNGIEELTLDCFTECPISSIDLPQSIRILEQNCFCKTKLTTVSIPSNVEYIDSLAFNESPMEAINVDEDNTHYVSDNGVLYTAGYKWLIIYPRERADAEYIINPNCDIIDSFAFRNVNYLQSLTIPDSLNFWSYLTFLPDNLQYLNVSPDNPTLSSIDGVIYSKDGTILKYYPPARHNTSFTVPSTVTTIADSALYRTKNLKELIIPNTVTNLGLQMCQESTALERVVFESGSPITELPDFVFNNCSSLKEVVFPERLKTIGWNAFINCALREINLPDSVTTIGMQAFAENRSLLSVRLPVNLNSMSYQAFADCPNLRYVYMPGNIQYATLNAFDRDEYVTIIGEAGSFAEQFATDAALAFSSDISFDTYYDFNHYDDEHCYMTILSTCHENGSFTHQVAIAIIGFDNSGFTMYLYPDIDYTILSDTVDTMFVSKHTAVVQGKSPWYGQRTFVYTCDWHISVIDPAVDPTCEDAGLSEGSHCEICGTILVPQQTLEALGHDWNATEYEWSDDNMSITATRICKRDPSHIDTETVSVTVTIISPTEETEGSLTYTSGEFTKDGFSVQTKSITIPALKDMSVMRLPNMLSTIEDEAFSNLACQAIIIPENCTTIGEYAFAGCTELLYVRIPASVTSYPASAFEGCNENLVVDWVGH